MKEFLDVVRLTWPILVILLTGVGILIWTRDKKEKKVKK
jgi:hypothetical protein